MHGNSGYIEKVLDFEIVLSISSLCTRESFQSNQNDVFRVVNFTLSAPVVDDRDILLIAHRLIVSRFAGRGLEY